MRKLLSAAGLIAFVGIWEASVLSSLPAKLASEIALGANFTVAADRRPAAVAFQEARLTPWRRVPENIIPSFC